MINMREQDDLKKNWLLEEEEENVESENIGTNSVISNKRCYYVKCSLHRCFEFNTVHGQ